MASLFNAGDSDDSGSESGMDDLLKLIAADDGTVATPRRTVDSLLGKPIFGDDGDTESEGAASPRRTVDSLLGKPIFGDDGEDTESEGAASPRPSPNSPPPPSPSQRLDIEAAFPQGMTNLLRFASLFTAKTMKQLAEVAEGHGKNGWMEIDELRVVMAEAERRAAVAPLAWWARQLRLCGLTIPGGTYAGKWFGLPQLQHFIGLQHSRKGHRQSRSAPAATTAFAASASGAATRSPSVSFSAAATPSAAATTSTSASTPRRVRAATPPAPASLQHLLANEDEIVQLRRALSDARCRHSACRCGALARTLALITLVLSANVVVALWQWRALAFVADDVATGMGAVPRALGHVATLDVVAWLFFSLLDDPTTPLAQALCCGGAGGRAARAGKAALGALTALITVAHVVIWLVERGSSGAAALGLARPAVMLGLAAGIIGAALYALTLLGAAYAGVGAVRIAREAASIEWLVERSLAGGDFQRGSALTSSRISAVFMKKQQAWERSRIGDLDAQHASELRGRRNQRQRARLRCPGLCGCGCAPRCFPAATLRGAAAMIALALAAAHGFAVQVTTTVAPVAMLHLRPGPGHGWWGGGWGGDGGGTNASASTAAQHVGEGTIFSRLLRDPLPGSGSVVAQWNDLLFPTYLFLVALLVVAMQASRSGTAWGILCCGWICPLKRSAQVVTSENVGGGATRMTVRLKKKRRGGAWRRELSWGSGQWLLVKSRNVRDCDWIPLFIASGDGGSGDASFIVLNRGEQSWGGALAKFRDPLQQQLLEGTLDYSEVSPRSGRSTMSANLDVSNILNRNTFSLVGTDIDLAGPFGGVETVATSASSVILVAGGIGIAPLIAILDSLFVKLSAQLMEQATEAVWGQRLCHVDLIWSVRQRSKILWLARRLQRWGSLALGGVPRLRVSVHVTADSTAGGADAGSAAATEDPESFLSNPLLEHDAATARSPAVGSVGLGDSAIDPYESKVSDDVLADAAVAACLGGEGDELLHAGRADESIVDAMHAACARYSEGGASYGEIMAKGGPRVAVVACGPPGLTAKVRRAAMCFNRSLGPARKRPLSFDYVTIEH